MTNKKDKQQQQQNQQQKQQQLQLLQKRCILGVNTSVRSVHLLNDGDQILYSCGNHVLIWNRHRYNISSSKDTTRNSNGNSNSNSNSKNNRDQQQVFLHQCGRGEEICFIELCHSRKQIAIVIKSSKSGSGRGSGSGSSVRGENGSGRRGGGGGSQIILYDAITFKRKKIIKPAETFSSSSASSSSSSIINTSTDDGSESDIIGLSFSKDGKHILILYDEPNYLLTLWNIEHKVPKVSASIRLATPSGKRIKHATIMPFSSSSSSSSSTEVTSSSSSSLSSSTDAAKEIIVCASGNGIIRFFKIVDGIFRPVTVNLRREQQNYVAQCWLSNGMLLLATDSNELIVMSNFVAKAVVSIEGWSSSWSGGSGFGRGRDDDNRIDKYHQSITSMISFSQGVVVGGSKGSVRVYTCTEENNYTPSLAKDLSVVGRGEGEGEGAGQGEIDGEDGHHVNQNINSSSQDEQILAMDRMVTEEMCACLTSTGRICSVPLSDNEIAIGENLVPWFHSAGGHDGPDGKDGKDGKCSSIIRCMEVCRSKPIVATGGSDKTLRIWNYQTKQFELIKSFQTNIVSISFHPSSLKVLVCCEDRVLLSYVHYRGLSTVWQREVQTNGLSCFSNGGQYFCLVCGPFVQVYDTYKLDPICTLRGHSSPIEAIGWRDDDQELATLGSDNVICMWKVSNGKRKLRHGE